MVGEEAKSAVVAEGGDAAGLGDVVCSVDAVQVDRGVAERREDVGCVAGARGGSVLVEGDITHPVHGILDAPVLA
jgi:hypothetical protein